MNAAQRRALRRLRGTHQNGASAEASPQVAARERLFLSGGKWLEWLLAGLTGVVVALFAEHLCLPWIAPLLPDPRVRVTVYRWNPEVSGLPCTRYSLSVEPQGGENIEAIDLGVEFPKPVKDYALAGTWHTVGEVQVMGEAVVLPGPEGCHFGLGTEMRGIPPKIRASMLPPPANKFALVATDVREPIQGRFIVPENPGQKEVIISGEYQYRRIGVPVKKAFDILTKTVTVN